MKQAADFLLALPSNDEYDETRYRCIESLTTAIQQAESEPDDVVRNAKRYEWLRQHQLLAKINYMPTPSGEDLDAAIDAAMLAAKKTSCCS